MDNLKILLITMVIILGLSTFYFWNQSNKAENLVIQYREIANAEKERAERLTEQANRAAAEAVAAAAEAERQKNIAEENAIEAIRQREIAKKALKDCPNITR